MINRPNSCLTRRARESGSQSGDTTQPAAKDAEAAAPVRRPTASLDEAWRRGRFSVPLFGKCFDFCTFIAKPFRRDHWLRSDAAEPVPQRAFVCLWLFCALNPIFCRTLARIFSSIKLKKIEGRHPLSRIQKHLLMCRPSM